ncbi:unnamed protein product [Lupinus luteus]|uniref:Uncharacterized protein n=1 Tax=Lupinus luteus TaxID=3873 RepID=A0AAV1WJZ6_LUPLU
MGTIFQPNPISSISILCSIIFILTSVTTQSLPFRRSQLSPYGFIGQFNIPRGILPRGATSYTFDNFTGQFTINLKEACTYKMQTFAVKFNTTITGIITKNNMSSLKGVQVRVAFWINIRKVSSIQMGVVKFEAGVIPIIVPAIFFKLSPPCIKS